MASCESWHWALLGLLQLANEGITMDLISFNTALSSCERCSRPMALSPISREELWKCDRSLCLRAPRAPSAGIVSARWREAVHIFEDNDSSYGGPGSLTFDIITFSTLISASHRSGRPTSCCIRVQCGIGQRFKGKLKGSQAYSPRHLQACL